MGSGRLCLIRPRHILNLLVGWRTEWKLSVDYDQDLIYYSSRKGYAMSVLSFKTYCIENYAEYKNDSSSEIFDRFFDSGLLKHLETDYEDLHGMGKEFLMDYFDKWFGEMQ